MELNTELNMELNNVKLQYGIEEEHDELNPSGSRISRAEMLYRDLTTQVCLFELLIADFFLRRE